MKLDELMNRPRPRTFRAANVQIREGAEELVDRLALERDKNALGFPPEIWILVGVVKGSLMIARELLDREGGAP